MEALHPHHVDAHAPVSKGKKRRTSASESSANKWIDIDVPRDSKRVRGGREALDPDVVVIDDDDDEIEAQVDRTSALQQPRKRPRSNLDPNDVLNVFRLKPVRVMYVANLLANAVVKELIL